MLHDESVAYTWPGLCRSCGSIQPTAIAKLPQRADFSLSVPSFQKSATPCNCGGARYLFPGGFAIAKGKLTSHGPFSPESITLLSKVLQGLADSGQPKKIGRATVERLLAANPDLALALELFGPDASGARKLPAWAIVLILSLLKVGMGKAWDAVFPKDNSVPIIVQSIPIDELLQRLEESQGDCAPDVPAAEPRDEHNVI